VRPDLGDAVKGGERAQPEILGRRIDPAVQGEGAQAPGHRQRGPGAGELVGEEVVVELGVVRDEHAVPQHRRDPRRHLVEDRRTAQPLGREPVDVHRPGIASGVEERRELLRLLPVRPQHHHGHRQHPVSSGDES
jgi:hypothetical protein